MVILKTDAVCCLQHCQAPLSLASEKVNLSRCAVDRGGGLGLHGFRHDDFRKKHDFGDWRGGLHWLSYGAVARLSRLEDRGVGQHGLWP